MSDQTLNQVKKLCQAYGIIPQRQKGQNFLINSAVVESMVKAADITKDNVILEVGPGLGILTESLIKAAKRVVSVELDQKLFSLLKAKFAGVNNLELVNQDILKVNPTSYLLLPTSYKIVASLPYNITSFFLKDFLTAEIKPSAMTLLVQKEVAERICAPVGNLSLLAISVQLYGQPKIMETVSRANFWPTPAVDSAILKIADIRNQKSVDNFFAGQIAEQFFWQIVRMGFSSKRKQLQNNLAACLKLPSADIKKLLNQANFDQKIRAQNLSVTDWLTLAIAINSWLKK